MEIAIKNLQTKIAINPRQLTKIIKIILRKERIKSVDLSFVFVCGKRIKALNKKFLHKSYLTDVISFDLSEECLSYQKKRPNRIVGEIVISTDAVNENAKTFNTSVSNELILYIIHGILHLLGYDDKRKKDKILMRKREEFLLRFISSKSKGVIA